jgi:phosphonatase-like hydrolase
MPSGIQLVVFDMAGTTVTDRHEVERCFAEAASQTALIVSPERILAMQGMGKHQVFRTLWAEQLGAQHPELEKHASSSYAAFRHTLEHHYETEGVTPTEGCLDTFAHLRERGIAIALTTGFYRHVTDIILNKLGWLDGLSDRRVGTSQTLIQASIASDEVAEGRPAPFLIQRAMHLLGISDPQAVVNIGDTPSDLLSGAAAGVRLNLGVVNGTHTHDQLATYPNDGLLGTLGEIVKLL